MTDIVVTAAPGSGGQGVSGVAGTTVSLRTPEASQGVAYNDDGAGWVVLEGGLGRNIDVSTSLLLRQVVAGNVVATIGTGSSSGGGSGGGGTGGGVSSGLPTFVAGNMGKWNTAKAKGYFSRGGGFSSQARVLFMGDSNVSGEGSGTGASGYTGAAITSMARKFGDAAGCRVSGFFGDQGSNQFSGRDARIVLGSGWAVDDSAPSILGGRFAIGQSPSAGALAFTPSDAFDSIRLWYAQTVGLNSLITVKYDATALETFSSSSFDALGARQYTIPRGTHTVNLSSGTDPLGGVAVIAGIETFDSQSATPILLACGTAGIDVAYLNKRDSAWNPGFMAATLQPDYTIIYCTINDNAAGTATLDYFTRMEAVVGRLAATSDGCLCVGFPANHDGTISGALDEYATALMKIAKDVGWSFKDARSVFGNSFAQVTARSLAYNDDHPNGAGHAAFAQALYADLSSAGF